jgi:hypothetical protein
MGAQTGTAHPLSIGEAMGSMYPIVNPKYNMIAPVAVRKTKRTVKAFRLEGTAAAIATDAYTFALYTSGRAQTLTCAYFLDPVGQANTGAGYNTFELKNATTVATMASCTTLYGVPADELREITRANAIASMTMAAGDAVTLVITGTSAGVIIHKDTLLFIVLDDA